MISNQYRCLFVHIPKTAGSSIEAALGWFKEFTYGVQDHRAIGELREEVSRVDFRDYFKFTFVRNPWDRVVSWYKNVLEDPVHREVSGIPETCSLREFLTVYGTNWGLQSQLHWIRESDGTIPLDFIGRFEKLEVDFAQVCQRIGASDIKPLSCLADATDRRPYTAFYDTETRLMIAQRYAEEIEMFGYKYGE